MHVCKVIRIENDTAEIIGVQRGEIESKKVIVFLSALTGTRIGPQRLFTECSRLLADNDYCAISFDLPPLGDSIIKKKIDFEGNFKDSIVNSYSYFLNMILDWLHKFNVRGELILASISLGCIPIFNYSIIQGFKRVILLSPNNLELSGTQIDKKNLRSYYLKLFKMQTWIHALSFKLNWKKISENIFIKSDIKGKKKEKTLVNKAVDLNKINVLLLLGGKDIELKNSRMYWKKVSSKNKNLKLDEIKVLGADHSFMGWEFKREVCSTILSWIGNE